MTRLSIPDMSCGHCKASVEKAVTSVDPAADIAVDLATRHVEITSASPVAAIISALKVAGYEATVA
jgi:copper chaperone